MDLLQKIERPTTQLKYMYIGTLLLIATIVVALHLARDTYIVFETLDIKGTRNNEPFRLVCYYNIPSEDNSNDNNGKRVHLPPGNMCTHVNLAFGRIRNGSIYLTDKQLESAAQVVDMKMVRPQLQVLLSLGGAGVDEDFASMVLTHDKRKTFIQSVLHLIKQYKLDGIDLDWEFPNRDNSKDKRQRQHFTQLLYEIRKEINRQEKHKFLLTVAVAAPTLIVDNSYDIEYMNSYVDFVNVMTYDYHFFSELTPFTGLNAPLYARSAETDYLATLNINYTVHYWIDKGMSPGKINVGLPTYGHSFRLINRNNNGLFAPSARFGNTGKDGFISYDELCQFLAQTRRSPVYDAETRSFYVVDDYEWISYENIESISAKTQFVKENKFGGVMIYSLNTDDPTGICSGGKIPFPLTSTVRSVLDSDAIVV